MFGLCSVSDAARRRRFSLLMLEEREYYFHDVGGYMHVTDDGRNAAATPFLSRRKLKGRIHICSKNLVFDPDDAASSIVRLPFRDIVSIQQRHAPGQTDIEYFVVHTRSAVEIPQHAQYVFHKLNLQSSESEYLLSLSYVETAPFLSFIKQLHSLYTLPRGEGVGSKSHALAEIIRLREEQIPFESSSIVDIRERALLPNGQAILAQQVQPLLLCPGRFQLTDARVYFQSFNNVSSEATSKLDVADIKRVYKRRFVMRDTAMEIFFAASGAANTSSNSSSSSSSGRTSLGTAAGAASSAASSSSSSSASASASSPLSQSSVYFNFPSKLVRDQVFDALCASPRFAPPETQSLTSMTRSWVRGETSNFAYLLYLNQHAGRSFMDLTQYPVFPWVLSNYTSASLDLNDPANYRDLSKPIGALNPERLKGFQRRMAEMPVEISKGHPFLYGTHYSSPGYVLYYLVRKAPQYMLKLQCGSFDKPDRLFDSIAACWNSVLTGPTDVKELLPEHYALGPELAGASSASPSAIAAASASVGGFLTNSLGLDLGQRQNGKLVEDVELPPWAHGSPREFIKLMRAALESDIASSHMHQWIDLIFGYKQRGEAAMAANNVFYYLTYEGAIELESVSDAQTRRSLELQINEFGQTPKQIFFRAHPRRGDADYAEHVEPEPSKAAVPSQKPLRRGLSSDEVLSPPPTASTLAFPNMSAAPSSALPLNQPLSGLTPSPANRDAADMARLQQDSDALQLAAEIARIQTKQLSLDSDDLGALSPMTRSPVSAAAQSATAASSSSSSHGPRFSPQWSYVGNDGWSVRETLSLHRDTITSLQYTPSGDNLVSVSADGHLKIYCVAESRLIRSERISDMTLSSCCVTADGRQVYVSAWDNSVSLYNLSFGRVVSSVQAHDDAVSCMAVSGGSMVTGSWDTTVKLFGVTEAAITERALAEFQAHDTALTAVAVDSTARCAVSGSEDGAIVMWDLRSKDGHARAIEGFEGAAVKSIVFAPDSLDFMVCSGGSAPVLRHMDSGSGAPLWQADTKSTLHVLRTDGASVIGVGDDGVVRGWNLRGAEQLMQFPTKLGPQVALALNADATVMATANQKATIWTHKSAKLASR